MEPSSSILQRYQELRASLLQYINDNCVPGQQCICDAESWTFFKEEARQSFGRAGPAVNNDEGITLAVAGKKTLTSGGFIGGRKPTEKVSKASTPATSPSKPATATPEAPTPKKNTTEATSCRVAKTFSLELLSAPLPTNHTELRTLISRLFPHLALTDMPLDDQTAKAINEGKGGPTMPPSVIIIAANEPATDLAFLQMVVQGISEHLAPAALIDVGSGATVELEGVKLLLITPQASTQFSTSGSVRCLFLDPLGHYAQNPPLKRQLWNQIRHAIHNKA